MLKFDDNINHNAAILELQVPFTVDEIKTAFRKKAFVTHPDHGGSKEEFIQVKQAYDFLYPFATNKETATTTAEGDLFANLGKGLGDTVNSKLCDKCYGNGWIKISHDKVIFDYECPVCHGKGYIGRNWFNICTACFGSGGIGEKLVKSTLIHTCHKCKGTGQIEILNPVLPKNRMFNNVKIKKERIKKQYCSCGALLKDGKCWRCK